MEIAIIDQLPSSLNQEPSKWQRKCWVCLTTDEILEGDDEEINNDWVSPCKCTGSTQWVHEGCILCWIIVKRAEKNNARVYCQLCNVEYIIVCDEVNTFVQILNKLDEIYYEISFVLASVGGFIILYWSYISYGTFTIMQVMGEEEALTMLDKINVFILILVLPLIPLGLVIVHMIDWEYTIILCVEKLTSQLPLLRNILPSFLYDYDNGLMSRFQNNSQFVPTIPIFCTAIFFPTAATMIGRLLFNNVSQSSFKKTLLGGLVYIAVKGVLAIYKRKRNIISQSTRKIMDYSTLNTEENN